MRPIPRRSREERDLARAAALHLEALAHAEGFTVEERILLDEGGSREGAVAERAANLLAAGAVYLLRR